jgi:hypothetical protein
MLINLRGTSGSSKTTIVRRLLHQWGARPIFGLLGLRAPVAYRLDRAPLDAPVYVLGPYRTSCGGCDALDCKWIASASTNKRARASRNGIGPLRCCAGVALISC